MRHAVDAMEVLDWPEFKALAERMGIELEVSTVRLVIDLQECKYAVVQHEYRAADKALEKEGSPEEVVPTWRRGF